MENPPIPPPRPEGSESPPPLFQPSAPPAIPPEPPPGRSIGLGPLVAIGLGVALVVGVTVGFLIASKSSVDDPVVVGSPGAIPSSWGTYNIPAEGFRLGLPPGWKDLPAGEVDSAMAELRKDNAELADLIESQLAGPLSTLIRFFAFDANSPTLAEQFATNANVVVEPLPVGIDFKQYLDANLRQLGKVPGVTILSQDENVTLPAGRAALIKSTFTLNSPQGPRPISVSQYLMLKGTRGFILSLTTLPSHEASYRSTFEQIAQTFAPL